MPAKKICVVTGSRADYGLLYWLMRDIMNDPELVLQVAVTGMHLSPEFGSTCDIIEADGFPIEAKVEMLLSSDTPVGITKSLGLGVIGFADVLDRLRPDIMILLGDRFECLAAAQSALIARIPVGHIGGGDITEGAYDDAIRHSITKLAHLHFVTNADSERRIQQLGENPDCVFNVGSLGIDYIRRMDLMNKDDVERELAFQFREKNLLITVHPVTLDRMPAETQLNELLGALDSLEEDYGLIFTMPNADTESLVLARSIRQYVSGHPNSCAFKSLGQRLYLSTMAIVDAVVGNSSSGLYEAPSLKKPSVNIGDRQKGRLQANSVVNCEPVKQSILNAIRRAAAIQCSDVENPYGDGYTADRIMAVLKGIKSPQDMLRKKFHQLD